MSSPEERTTKIVKAQPFSVRLTRGQRGGYGWEINVDGSDPGQVFGQVAALDVKLRAKFASAPKGGEPLDLPQLEEEVTS